MKVPAASSPMNIGNGISDQVRVKLVDFGTQLAMQDGKAIPTWKAKWLKLLGHDTAK